MAEAAASEPWTTATPPVTAATVGRVATGAQLGLVRTFVGVAAVVLGVRYVVWQASIAPSSLLGVAFVTAEVASMVLFTVTVVTLSDRGTRAPRGTPTGTLDVFLTVCGEPAAIVESALRSAIAIEYPHRTVVLNDGRLAGKPDWEGIDRLGRALGCEVITRTTGSRGKAGNLNHGLASSSAQFVATIDADHRADGDLAARTLGWFADPDVAFVTTGQRFVGDVEVLNSREDFFYRALQPAKDAAGCAISCGSGVVYRRAALDGIGGFSEWNVVEDLHTSYRLHAAGWTSVYEREPVTTGLAPPTAGEYAHQRARWALDSMRLFLLDNPLWRRGLGVRQRIHYLHTTGTYLLTIPFLVYLFGPALYVLGRVPVAGGSTIGEYTGHTVPYLGAVALYFTSILGLRGALRTFRSTLFNSTFALTALVRAVAGHRSSGVTRKDAPRRSSWLLAPQGIAVILLIASLVVALTDAREAASPVAVGWAAVLAVGLVAPLAAISSRPALVRRGALIAQVLVVALGVVAVAGAWRESTVALPAPPVADPRAFDQAEFAVPAGPIVSASPTAARPVTVADTTTATVATTPETAVVTTPDTALDTTPVTVGDTTPTTVPETTPTTTVAPTSTLAPTTTAAAVLAGPLAVPATGAFLGVSSEGIQTDPGGIAAWSAGHADAQPAIVHWFQQWGSGENRFRADWVSNVIASGAVPMISWEPWAKPEGVYAAPEQTDFRLDAIIAGQFDPYIRSWADGAAAYGGPLLIRFMHEFNGEWYPWSIGLHDQTPEEFVAAWRHVHAIFQEAGATNVSWVWSTIRGFHDPRPAYPGDDVVDWVAATVLNTGDPDFGGWLAYGFLVGDVYDQLATYGKPVMLAEVATTAAGDTATWWGDLLVTVREQQPLVRAVVVFDMPYNDEIDYRVPPEASSVLAAATEDGWFSARP